VTGARRAASIRRRFVTWAIGAMAVLLVAGGCTGCWDQLPFYERALALAITVSPTKTRSDWHYTFVFANPAVTISSLGQMSSADQLFAVSVKAPTLSQAVGRADKRLSRQVYIGQLQDLVWSAKMPSSAAYDLILAYNRHGLTAKTVFVAVTAGQPQDAVKPTLQEVVPDMFLTKYFSCRGCQPVTLSEKEWELWITMETPGVSPVVPIMSGPNTVDEVTVYPNKGEPVTFTPEETRGWGFLLGRVHNAALGFGMPEGRIAVDRIEATVANHISWTPTGLAVRAEVRAQGMVAEWPPTMPLTPQRIRKLETLAARKILHESLAAVRRAQTTHTDPFGYWRDYLYQHPSLMGQKTVAEWDQMPYHVHVSVTMSLIETGVNT
jgi:spore germination protein KC